MSHLPVQSHFCTTHLFSSPLYVPENARTRNSPGRSVFNRMYLLPILALGNCVLIYYVWFGKFAFASCRQLSVETMLALNAMSREASDGLLRDHREWSQ